MAESNRPQYRNSHYGGRSDYKRRSGGRGRRNDNLLNQDSYYTPDKSRKFYGAERPTTSQESHRISGRPQLNHDSYFIPDKPRKKYGAERWNNRKQQDWSSWNANDNRQSSHGSRRSSGRPPHLRGKDIGMYYAKKSKERAKLNEELSMPSVEMNKEHFNNVTSLLKSAKCNIEVPSNYEEENFEPTFTSQYWHHQLHKTQNEEYNNSVILREREKLNDSSFCEMLNYRKTLPSFQMKEEVITLLDQNQVVLITGETGCGKTTQIPQYILDNMIEAGDASSCKIVCTQPRRISAISVAERVATERGEKCGGEQNSCGYQIALESRFPRQSASILYCTTGIVLQWLKSNSNLDGVSHVILDEIHERNINSDFLLAVVKDIIKIRNDIKIILMSATMNAKIFSEYFNNCPQLHIPGFTYPVERFYLEDVIQMFNYQAPNKVLNSSKKNQHFDYRKLPRLQRNTTNLDAIKKYVNSCDLSHQGKFTVNAISQYIENEIEYDLIISLIKHIMNKRKPGAILIFLPGWSEISNLNNMLKKDYKFNASKTIIIPLHSMIPTSSQRSVFKTPPQGCTKIIISTSIAETSITINDVVHVIDCGKMKTTSFNIKNDLAMLQSSWITKSNGLQRCGRAGRVQDGYCYHLYTRAHEENFSQYEVPEILRTPLDNLCLQVRYLKLGLLGNFLSKVLEAPSSDAVILAFEKLRSLNAISDDQDLTPLGYHLAKLPVEPQIGKMILLGAMFGCINPILTVAATLSFKDPFHIPLGKEKQVDECRQKFVSDHNSDHMMIVNAFDEWEKECSNRNSYNFCRDNFLSESTLSMIKNCKVKFAQRLFEIGFLHTADPFDVSANTHSDNTKVVNAIICAGLYPNVLKVLHKHSPTAESTPNFKDKSGMKLQIHGKSINKTLRSVDFTQQWLCFYEKIRTSGTFVFDCCEVSPYPLLFFGGKITSGVQNNSNVISVDDWITFKAQPRTSQLVKDLRKELDKILEKKIQQKKKTEWEDIGHDNDILSSILEIITTE